MKTAIKLPAKNVRNLYQYRPKANQQARETGTDPTGTLTISGTHLFKR